jgi:hypothetical protein
VQYSHWSKLRRNRPLYVGSKVQCPVLYFSKSMDRQSRVFLSFLTEKVHSAACVLLGLAQRAENGAAIFNSRRNLYYVSVKSGLGRAELI